MKRVSIFGHVDNIPYRFGLTYPVSMSHDMAIIVGFTPPVSPSLNWLVVSNIF